MKVLVVHNAYRQRGGEDAVAEAEIELLRQQGHSVWVYRRSNVELDQIAPASAALQTFWSRRTLRELQTLIADAAIELVHVHNSFPLVSPSVYWAAWRARLPVVQTLHNFRLVCPQALMLRAGRPCEDCVGRTLAWPAIQHACYRDSRAQTAVLTGMLAAHRVLGTWRHKVDRYIALNDFCRERFIAGGLPAERIVVKPNFVDAGPAPDEGAPREGVLFVGRLAPEKGVGVLAEAMRSLAGRIPLTVVGEGPSASLLDGLPGVRRLGALSGPAVLAEMRRARLLVLPSIWYENFPRTLVEAFASGLPVLASRLGAMASLVRPGIDGDLFAPGDAASLAAKLAELHGRPEHCRDLGRGARLRYDEALNPTANYLRLMQIYREAAESAARR